jgi:short-subunit dehydrogenase
MAKQNKNIIVLGINADIGSNIAKFFLQENYNVIGTYRNKKPKINELKNLKNLKLIKCDINLKKDLNKILNYLKNKKIKWDTLFSSIGTTVPIGNFFNLNFEKWKNSINTNFLSQLEILHKIYPYRYKAKANVVYLAGGGTNNPFTNYSAYCVSKIGLIKMCELLDDESKNLNIFIVGPGFTKTKTHLETINAGKNAGKNYKRVKKFLQSDNPGTSFKKIYECINWGISEGRKVVGGRNLSVVHDKWGKNSLKKKLIMNSEIYKLRRYKN